MFLIVSAVGVPWGVVRFSFCFGSSWSHAWIIYVFKQYTKVYWSVKNRYLLTVLLPPYGLRQNTV